MNPDWMNRLCKKKNYQNIKKMLNSKNGQLPIDNDFWDVYCFGYDLFKDGNTRNYDESNLIGIEGRFMGDGYYRYRARWYGSAQGDKDLGYFNNPVGALYEIVDDRQKMWSWCGIVVTGWDRHEIHYRRNGEGFVWNRGNQEIKRVYA